MKNQEAKPVSEWVQGLRHAENIYNSASPVSSAFANLHDEINGLISQNLHSASSLFIEGMNDFLNRKKDQVLLEGITKLANHF